MEPTKAPDLAAALRSVGAASLDRGLFGVNTAPEESVLAVKSTTHTQHSLSIWSLRQAPQIVDVIRSGITQLHCAHSLITASAPISTFHRGSRRAATTIKLAAGRTSLKMSPCTCPTASASAADVKYIRVLTGTTPMPR